VLPFFPWKTLGPVIIFFDSGEHSLLEFSVPNSLGILSQQRTAENCRACPLMVVVRFVLYSIT